VLNYTCAARDQNQPHYYRTHGLGDPASLDWSTAPADHLGTDRVTTSLDSKVSPSCAARAGHERPATAAFFCPRVAAPLHRRPPGMAEVPQMQDAICGRPPGMAEVRRLQEHNRHL
jgi:hypothetical protein